MTSPAVVNGVVYVNSHGYLYALNTADGTQVWSTHFYVTTSPSFANGVIYVGGVVIYTGGADYFLYAVNANDGSIKWSCKTGGSLISSPAVVDGVVYGGSLDGKVYAIGKQPTPPHGSTPTTFGLSAASQSVKPNAVVRLYGTLRTGATGLPGQPAELWVKAGSGAWYKAGTWTTGTGGLRSWDVWSTGQVAQTIQYYFFFPGTSTYAAAKSNVIAIKFETTKTTPYQTTLYAYAPKPVVPHGTTNTMWVKLTNGGAPLTGQYVFVWKWSGGKFVIVSRIITRVASQSPGAGWAQADYRWNPVGTGMYKFTYFGTSPSGIMPYARSESNAVLLRWT